MKIIKINDTLHKLYYVGGVVRDELLGIESFDTDITCEGNAIDIVKTLDNIEILQVNEPFGTVRVKFDDNEVDIASTRSEIYEKKGHLPVVTKIGCSLQEDALRRDFTINALFKSLNDGKIYDFTGGLDDLKNKILRVLHDESFIDDPTRILRALKFSVRFGFELDEHTKNLRDNYLKNINYDMSYKRLKKELIETFNLNLQQAFEKFINEKIYKLVTPNDVELPEINIENLVSKYSPKNIWIVYVGVLEDLSRLPLTKDEMQILDDYKKIGEPISDLEIYRAFENLKIESILLYAILKDYDKAIKYLDILSKIKLEITGDDLVKLGIKPSKIYGEIFDNVLSQKLKNPDITKEQELEIVKNIVDLS